MDKDNDSYNAQLEDPYLNMDRECCSKKKLLIVFIAFLTLSIFIFLIIFFALPNNKNDDNSPIICNPGYFIPENEKNCKKCSLENCKECYGKENLNYCTSCIDSYIPFYLNNSINVCEKSCEEGEGENCLTCDKLKNQCFQCNIGYYIPEFSEKSKNVKNVVLKIVKNVMGIAIQIFALLVETIMFQYM